MNPTEEFLDQLSHRRHEPLLEKMSGSVRFDVVQGKKTESWMIRVNRGDVEVSQDNSEADCVLRASRQLMDEITSGRTNAVAALMRGAFDVQGNLDLLLLLQRLLPCRPQPDRPPVTEAAGRPS
jgi:putative sterol carrier protein